MLKDRKRYLPLLLSFAMLISMFGTPAFGEESVAEYDHTGEGVVEETEASEFWQLPVSVVPPKDAAGEELTAVVPAVEDLTEDPADTVPGPQEGDDQKADEGTDNSEADDSSSEQGDDQKADDPTPKPGDNPGTEGDPGIEGGPEGTPTLPQDEQPRDVTAPKITMTSTGSSRGTTFYCVPPTITVTDDERGLKSVTISYKVYTTSTQFEEKVFSVSCEEGAKSLSFNPTTYTDYMGAMIVTAEDLETNQATASFAFTHQSIMPQSTGGEATCTESGSTEYAVCRECNAVLWVLRPGKPLGHSWTELGEANVCGYKGNLYKCSRCDITVKADSEAALANYKYATESTLKAAGLLLTGDESDHTWKEDTKDATCLTAGYKRMKCSVCGAIKDEEILPALGHNYGDWVVEGGTDCTQGGRRVKTCTNPGCPRPEIVENFAGGHKYVSHREEPTCTTEGKQGRWCSVCHTWEPGFTVIPKLGHKYTGSGDCTKSMTCEVCGAQSEPQTAHNFATKYNASTTQHWQVCTNEGCKVTTDPVSHSLPEGSKLTNCTDLFTCPVCSYSRSQLYTGHEYTYVAVDNTYHRKKCTRCAYAESGMQIHTAVDDHNCTTEDKCPACGQVVNPARESHNLKYISDSSKGTHMQRCFNSGCTYATEMQPHDVVRDNNCLTVDRCSICNAEVTAARKSHVFDGVPYISNGDYHYKVCANEHCLEQANRGRHSGGTATCKSPAVCEVCKEYYGTTDATNHTGDTVLKGSISATQTEDGYSGDLYCADCNQMLKKGETVPALSKQPHEHKYVKQYDSQKSWQECEICGDVINKVDHKLSQYYSNSDGHWQICETCEYKTSTVPHVQETADFDCTTPLRCVDCGYEIEAAQKHNFSSEYAMGESGHWHTCLNDKCHVTSEVVPHKGTDDGNCNTALYCDECKYEMQPVLTHVYSPVWNQGDTNGHYQHCENPGCEARNVEAHTPDMEDDNCETPIVCKVCQFILTPAQSHSFDASPYFGDETGHWRVCQNPKCGQHSKIEEHTGGTATCNMLAICSLCEQSYGKTDPENHNGETEIRNHKDPTTTEEGYTGDVYCLGCEKLISRGQTLNRLASDHEHSYRLWDHDSTHHWLECACGTRNEETVTEHTLGQWYSDANGHWQVCETCGYISASTPHTPQEHDYDCTTALLCTICEHEIEPALTHRFDTAYAYDENEHWQICLNPNCVQVNDHEAHHAEDDGDCTTELVCDDCGYIVRAAQEHSFVDAWESDEESHWMVCENEGCQATTSPEKHTGGTATCASPAICTACGLAYGEKDGSNHTGETETLNYREATEVVDGYSGDVYCVGCGQLLKEGSVLPAAGPTLAAVNTVRAVSAGKHTVQVTWSAVENADGYVVYRRTGNGAFERLADVKEPGYKDTTAIADGWNFYRVYAYAVRSGRKAQGPTGNYSYAKGILPAVKNLSGKSAKGKVVVTWDPVEGATGYLVYRKDGKAPFHYHWIVAGSTYEDVSASSTDWTFYRIYPYFMENGKRVVTQQSLSYAYGKVLK